LDHPLSKSPLLLLSEDLAAHLEHTLKAFATLDGVLVEPANKRVLDAVLDALPATAEGSDACALHELSVHLVEGLLDNLLLDVD